MTLHPVRGHQDFRDAVQKARAAGTLPAALLLHGPQGVGKQRLALWIAQLALCLDPTPAGPCDRCTPCRLALRLEHPDVHWYFPLPRPLGASSPEKMGELLEEARFARLAELRDNPLHAAKPEGLSGIYLAAALSLRRRAHSRPSMGAEQFFIVGDAETLVPQSGSEEAANALLKLLEEPPAGTRLILTSSKPGDLLDTIRSRTVPLVVRPLSVQAVQDFLVERGVPADEAETAARLSGGAIGRALGFLEVETSKGPERGHLEEWRRTAFGIVKAALADRPGAGFRLALSQKTSESRNLVGVLAATEVWLRDLAAVAAGAADEVVDPSGIAWLSRQTREKGVTPEQAIRSLARIDQAVLHARGNVNPQLLIAGLISDLRALLRPDLRGRA